MATFYIGQRLSYDSVLCTVRYIGQVTGTKGEWLGVEWDDASRGKHNGENAGVKYFKCKAENAGSFVRPNRPFDPPRTFLEGLKRKYVTDPEEPSKVAEPIEFGNKKVEEVGFAKVAQKFSEVQALRRVLLDFMCIKTCDFDTDKITKSCPAALDLDLTCNLFEDLAQVAKISSSIPQLSMLILNGNRFTNIAPSDDMIQNFERIKVLRVEDLRLEWSELFTLLSSFNRVTDLSLAVNNLTHLDRKTTPSFLDLSLVQGLTSICLDENSFESISALSILQDIPCLQRLLLSRCIVSGMYDSASAETADIVFRNVEYLDVSNNKIAEWRFLDDLGVVFPKLSALRISRNPLYLNQESRTLSDEAYMFTVGRLDASVKMLNYSQISMAERTDCELFYLSTIVRELSENPVEHEREVLTRHPRWNTLQELHGPQSVNRNQSQKSKNALASKLIEVELSHATKTISKRFPRSIKIAKLSGLIGRLFNTNPLAITLVLIEDDIAGPVTVRETLLTDELRDLDYYVDGEHAKIAVRDK